MSIDDQGRSEPQTRAGVAARAEEWGRRWGALTIGWLVFETASGLVIWLLPFSVPSQWLVVVHTGAGLLFLPAILAYQIGHTAAYWRRPATPLKMIGYLATLATSVAIVSGVVLTIQSIWGRRISYAWDQAHILSTVALIVFTLPHVGIPWVRDRDVARKLAEARGVLAAQRRVLRGGLVTVVALVLVTGALWLVYPGERMRDAFPPDYSFRYGEERPFAPSLARTATGGAYDPRRLAGSESCGTSGCHEQITAEWSVSAHRWAAMDTAFQRIQSEMARQNGPESTRYCGGCHDPISLFSGSKNIFTDTENLTGAAGYHEGVSCLACHSIRETDVQGNAHFVVAQPRRYLFEHRTGRAARLMRDFLIRAYPRQHVADLGKRLFKTPEYCAACHKQFIDQEVNNVGWVQLQNQFDNWRKSHWNHPGDATRTIECRECHMPLQASTDPAAGDPLDYNRSATDGKHRSHRFLGANQLMPTLLDIPGGDEQARLTEQWLRGEIPIPEIADKWTTGPVVTLALEAPEEVAAGGEVRVRAVITANKVGHDFPTGPLDIIQSWVELSVVDESGAVVYASGGQDERHFIEPGTFMFKAEPVDRYGNLIDRHNLWEMVGVRYRRSLFPGFSDTAEYTFNCAGEHAGRTDEGIPQRELRVLAPTASKGHLTIRARLMYRKIDQYLLNFMFGEGAGLTTPVTEMARAETVVRIARGDGGPSTARPAVDPS